MFHTGEGVTKIKIVVATRASKENFMTQTATGRSLRLLRSAQVELHLHTSNAAGLPELYNRAIKASAQDPCTLVFMHDDLHLLDYFWLDRVQEGLARFDVIGLAGNKRRVDYQPGWPFTDRKFTWDSPENLSGMVGHGSGFPPRNLSVFGPSGQQVKLLDGLMLCARSQTLIDKQLLFDERFKFHFYDMDFCRQAEEKQITCGTWPISLIHESSGAFGTPSWRESYEVYINKWGR